jgi:hypothetical protein
LHCHTVPQLVACSIATRAAAGTGPRTRWVQLLLLHNALLMNGVVQRHKQLVQPADAATGSCSTCAAGQSLSPLQMMLSPAATTSHLMPGSMGTIALGAPFVSPACSHGSLTLHQTHAMPAACSRSPSGGQDEAFCYGTCTDGILIRSMRQSTATLVVLSVLAHAPSECLQSSLNGPQPANLRARPAETPVRHNRCSLGDCLGLVHLP